MVVPIVHFCADAKKNNPPPLTSRVSTASSGSTGFLPDARGLTRQGSFMPYRRKRLWSGEVAWFIPPPLSETTLSKRSLRRLPVLSKDLSGGSGLHHGLAIPIINNPPPKVRWGGGTPTHRRSAHSALLTALLKVCRVSGGLRRIIRRLIIGGSICTARVPPH